MGASGSHIPLAAGFRKVGQTDPVGGHLGGAQGFGREDRFLRPKAQAYPVEIGRYSTMKEVTQDAFVTSQQMPGHLNNISGYTGYKPRCPTAKGSSAEWASI